MRGGVCLRPADRRVSFCPLHVGIRVSPSLPTGEQKGFRMDNIWFASALWIGLALIASAMQAWVAVSVALLAIIIGAVPGNLVELTLTPWVNYLAGFGAILLTFLAGAEIDVKVIRRNFR